MADSRYQGAADGDDGLRAKFFKLNVFAKEFVPRSPQFSAATTKNDGDTAVGHADSQQHDEQKLLESLSLAKPNSERFDSNVHSRAPTYDNQKLDRVNVIFMGHQNAGRSAIVNIIKYLFDLNDLETCKNSNKKEEQESTETLEVDRVYFQTENKQVTILDSPGEKNFVANVFGGTSLVDIAVLVVSAVPEEFYCECNIKETRNNAMLAKAAGATFMIILINKMDYPTVMWSKTIFEGCKNYILPFLQNIGFNVFLNLKFIPVSGRCGFGISYQSECYWYRGNTLLWFIDSLLLLDSRYTRPFTMPIVDLFKEKETTVVTGTVKSGRAKNAQSLMLMPNKTRVIVDQLSSSGEVVTLVGPGQNIEVKLKDVIEENFSLGLVLCDSISPISTCRFFNGQVVILDHNISIEPGYTAILHMHKLAVAIEVKAIICLVDQNTGIPFNTQSNLVKHGQISIMRIECSELICLEEFETFPEMGRFTLQNEGKTVAVGKVKHVIR